MFGDTIYYWMSTSSFRTIQIYYEAFRICRCNGHNLGMVELFKCVFDGQPTHNLDEIRQFNWLHMDVALEITKHNTLGYVTVKRNKHEFCLP